MDDGGSDTDEKVSKETQILKEISIEKLRLKHNSKSKNNGKSYQ